jgi:transposase
MTKQRRAFSPEFKLHIVQLIQDQGLSITQVCKHQSLGQSTIHRWLAQYDAEVRGEHVIGAAPITADQRRIRELEEQNKRLQEDVAILKKLPPSLSNRCANAPSHDLYCPRRLRQTAGLCGA